ncbi:hypothetical protein C8Q80DRAFT_101692 [Daedaleopsis nitida]|nr:hypothetical protein C8Q80DRAFT_101692 [Daedaleopsis nitida]
MRFISSFALSVVALTLSTSAANVPEKRQNVVPTHGTTIAPTDGTTVSPGTTFPFTYNRVNYCESGYTPISVYLSSTAPANAAVTNGELANGSYVYKFGDYLFANFGLPQMGTPPPSTLDMPSLDGVAEGTTLYLSVIETYRDCPGHVALEYGLETTTVIY